MVQEKGIEPLRHTAQNFEFCVSAYFTILALAEVVGLEPTNTGVKVLCLNLLGYTPRSER